MIMKIEKYALRPSNFQNILMSIFLDYYFETFFCRKITPGMHELIPLYLSVAKK